MKVDTNIQISTVEHKYKSTSNKKTNDSRFTLNVNRSMREENGEKIQIGGSAYTTEEWNKLLEKYDKIQEIIKLEMKQEKEEGIKKEFNAKIQDKIIEKKKDEKKIIEKKIKDKKTLEHKELMEELHE